jgi:hypothetical protein
MVWVLVPVLGGALVWMLVSMKGAAPKPEYAPPPTGPVAPQSGPSPARAMTYLQRLDGANAAWVAVKFVPGAAAAGRAVFLSTLDVVGGMAATDAAAGRISGEDLANIKAKIEALKQTA